MLTHIIEARTILLTVRLNLHFLERDCVPVQAGIHLSSYPDLRH